MMKHFVLLVLYAITMKSLELKVQDVNPDIRAVANPDTIRLGETSQLNVVGDDNYELKAFSYLENRAEFVFVCYL